MYKVTAHFKRITDSIKVAMRFLVMVFSLMLIQCSDHHDIGKLDEFSKLQLVEWNRKLTDVIIADIFTPPVASRLYAYPNIAAYEAMRFLDVGHQSYAGRLKGLGAMPEPKTSEEYYFPLAGATAFTTVARELVYNRQAIETLENKYFDSIQNVGINSKVFERSVNFGREVGNRILTWAGEDGYNQRTSLMGYQVDRDPGRWQPTPPDYMEAIEPHWGTLRTFVLDSANQFMPGMPTAFDTIPNSKFYQETLEVYETVKGLDDEQLAIAKFWDCNPNISFTQGHVMYFHQQISPGGHWVHITAQVLEEKDRGPLYEAEIFSKVCITLADAFISCWDEKYRSNLIRPETYINRYIDTDWNPILQTPAFPEHTSGHSVASSSAATMLTHLIGDNYAFIDSTEVPFGLPPRDFKSFYEASEEAAISRLYGGIHYLPAIKKGVDQGRNIGEFIIKKLEEHGE
ncbi:vanadium-dependent haloperoxidase [Fulvivirgaceae bacterium BMA12]|uniref:Vanadium-dependent haloperoxidase n=1 Tax=Agaribacillus aureus TaxID=3051825 RepID=A0ABT8L235_9BACT|nr:vanadium-dependent haloperoxidase [Fulvivirgaceae bacterium BMA12]